MPLTQILEPMTNLFDWLHHCWEHPRTEHSIALCILLVFLGDLALIELNRQGLLGSYLTALIPHSHFHAINLAFTLILGTEVMGLILILSCSLSRALGKQFEILILIHLRDAFKELSHLSEPINLGDSLLPVLHIALSGMTALGIFICLGMYRRINRHDHFIPDPLERMRYVMAKKLVALLLFFIFLGELLWGGYQFLQYGVEIHFFETIYTVLIFADITLVLISHRFMPSFFAVFRNSGFVIATLMLRLSLSAPQPWNNALSMFAALYMLGLTWAMASFAPNHAAGQKRP